MLFNFLQTCTDYHLDLRIGAENKATVCFPRDFNIVRKTIRQNRP